MNTKNTMLFWVSLALAFSAHSASADPESTAGKSAADLYTTFTGESEKNVNEKNTEQDDNKNEYVLVGKEDAEGAKTEDDKTNKNFKTTEKSKLDTIKKHINNLRESIKKGATKIKRSFLKKMDNIKDKFNNLKKNKNNSKNHDKTMGDPVTKDASSEA